jgi:hypothetical protein
VGAGEREVLVGFLLGCLRACMRACVLASLLACLRFNALLDTVPKLAGLDA